MFTRPLVSPPIRILGQERDVMGTFVSMMTWCRGFANEASVRAAIDREELQLWAVGLRSVIFLPDERDGCSAVMVSSCADHAAAARIAGRLLGDDLLRVDSLRFDEPSRAPAWMRKRGLPGGRRSRSVGRGKVALPVCMLGA